MFIEFVGMTLEDMQLIVKYEVCMCSQYSISIFFNVKERARLYTIMGQQKKIIKF